MELKEYIKLFRRWRWLLILLIAIGGAVSLAISLVRPPVYEATTTVLINQAPGALPDAEAVLQGQRVASTYAELLQQRSILEAVLANLGLSTTPDALDKQLTVTPIRDTNLLELTVRDHDPVLAANIANEIVQVFIERNVEFQESRYADSLANLQTEMERTQANIEALEAQLDTFDLNWTALTTEELAERNRVQELLSDNRAEYASLLAQFEEVRLAQAQTTDKVTVVDSAKPPNKRAGPSPVLVSLIGAIVGAMVTTGVVMIIEHLDDTIHSENEVMSAVELPTLAAIGTIQSIEGQCDALVTLAKPDSPISEAYRMLQTKLAIASENRAIKSVLVTSSVPLEGKTTTAANLAITMAQAGKRTVLVDLDLRRPMLHNLFGLPNRRGVTTALLEDPANMLAAGNIGGTAVDGLWILTSGPQPPNPADLLQSHKINDLIEELEQLVDIVIVDSPPVLATADAVQLSHVCDATVLVVLANSTKDTTLQMAKQHIISVDAYVAGVVLNKAELSRNGYSDKHNYYPSREE